MECTTFRDLIDKKARALSALDRIHDQNDIAAVRSLQQYEGFSPCFATQTITCSRRECLWFRTCCDLSPYRQVARLLFPITVSRARCLF
jgi:hypothetical protein